MLVFFILPAFLVKVIVCHKYVLLLICLGYDITILTTILELLQLPTPHHTPNSRQGTNITYISCKAEEVFLCFF